MFVKVRNPLSSFYNYISGRPQPSSKNQMSYIQSLSPQVKSIFPDIYIVKGYLCFNYLSGYGQADKMDLTTEEKKILLSQTMEKVKSLHAEGFIHGDVKLKNIMFNSETQNSMLVDIDYLEPINEKNLAYEVKQAHRLHAALGLSTDEE